jgi:hypothetical protein
MRSAGNFHPEWGYLAPAPSFMRTVRIVVVATAVGATAGAGVVASLVERPASDAGNTLLAAHALVTRVKTAAPVSAPVQRDVVRQSALPQRREARTAAAGEARPASTPQAPAGIAVLAETPPATATQARSRDVAIAKPDSVSAQRKVVDRRRRSPAYEAARSRDVAITKPDSVSAQRKVVDRRRRSPAYEAARSWRASGGAFRNRSANNGLPFGPLLRRLFSDRNGWQSDSHGGLF